MQKQVFVARPMQSSTTTKVLKRCTVLAEADGKVTCMCEGDKEPVTVEASATRPVPRHLLNQPIGAANVTKMYPNAPHALGRV